MNEPYHEATSGGFFCETCGEHHAEPPLEFGAEAPTPFLAILPEEREIRCDLTSDLCVIDDGQFFLRGCLELPITDASGPFIWGVWVSLSEASFRRTIEIWERADRATEPPMFGWLSTLLPLHPNTLNLKTHVHTRPPGQRPFIELEPTDHPLAIEQREGISMKQVREIAERLLHPELPN